LCTRARAWGFAFALAHGAGVAATPRAAAAGADVVLTCLPTSREVEALLDGTDGLLAGLGRGALFVDCTSGDPAASRRLAARLGEHGVAFADAPVSGGTNGAEAGTLAIMVGADQ
jgi:3-hydroxyisobutyrate dehydrogenase